MRADRRRCVQRAREGCRWRGRGALLAPLAAAPARYDPEDRAVDTVLRHGILARVNGFELEMDASAGAGVAHVALTHLAIIAGARMNASARGAPSIEPSDVDRAQVAMVRAFNSPAVRETLRLDAIDLEILFKDLSSLEDIAAGK